MYRILISRAASLYTYVYVMKFSVLQNFIKISEFFQGAIYSDWKTLVETIHLQILIADKHRMPTSYTKQQR